MKVKAYLNKVAVIKNIELIDGNSESKHEAWYTKFDDTYLIGDFDKKSGLVKFLAEHEVTDELSARGLGFSPLENKWYGWSHRAIFGFEVGSTCKKGDCCYTASTPEELIDDHSEFFADISAESAALHRAECQILEDRSGIRILHIPMGANAVVGMDKIEDLDIDAMDCSGSVMIDTGFSVVACGRGAWTAETLEDAKQMAKDFRSGVS